MKYLKQIVKRDEIWWMELDPTQGHEINKTRPCLILRADTLNEWRKTVVVVPLSSSANAIPPLTVAISSCKIPSVAMIDQIRAIAKHRLKSKIGAISDEEMKAVANALMEILELI